jgi:hypothetical protein
MDYKTVRFSWFIVKLVQLDFQVKLKLFTVAKRVLINFTDLQPFFVGFESLNTMAIMTARPHGYIGELYAEM